MTCDLVLHNFQGYKYNTIASNALKINYDLTVSDVENSYFSDCTY